jgi:type I restriction enzyme R subunit
VTNEDGTESDVTEWVKTSNLTPDEILANFRNSFYPRVAVTVDMISTGTDVKPIECVFFMRNVKSAGFFEQMKGRGVRVISPDKLRTVTRLARIKDRFIIVDAVGVCEEEIAARRMLSFIVPSSDQQPSAAEVKRFLAR